MRKTSYALTFIAVAVGLLLNILSILRHDWLYVHPPDIFRTRTIIRYGLLERCDQTVMDIPGPGGHGTIRYNDYTCRRFPDRKEDLCEEENREFCTLWWTAGYSAELSVVFGAGVLMAILIGVSTRSRRRRVWRAIAGLNVLHAAFKIVAFGIVTNAYQEAAIPSFEYARPSTAYVLNTLSWVLDVLTTFGVLITGLAAEAGHAWAAGHRAYRPIEG